jgi:hypothetical protein
MIERDEARVVHLGAEAVGRAQVGEGQRAEGAGDDDEGSRDGKNPKAEVHSHRVDLFVSVIAGCPLAPVFELLERV